MMSIIIIAQNVNSQIPTKCTDRDSLLNLECCPDNCGADKSRGRCVNLDLPHNMGSMDVRENWPHYFTRACNCTGNYGGVDCSRCKYGYYGINCEEYAVLPRKPIHKLTDQDWTNYLNILKMSRTYDSGYQVVLDQSPPGSINIRLVKITLYNIFIWLHHFAAKDSECGGK